MCRVISRNKLSRLLTLLLLLGACQQLGTAGLIKAKAWLAPILIQRAWSETLARSGRAVKPWPWADTWPVARLRFEGRGVEQFVLAGDTGHALAFGPGHSSASAPLGSAGLAVIGGHRDTHFAFLETVSVGEALQLQLSDGSWRQYTVDTMEIVDSSRSRLPRLSGSEQLLLVTCYPFRALSANGPLRFVVSARPREEKHAAIMSG